MSEFDPPPELKMKPAFMRGKPNHTDSNRGAGRGRGRGHEPVDEGQFVQMKSVFAEGPMQRQDAFLKSGICWYFDMNHKCHIFYWKSNSRLRIW